MKPKTKRPLLKALKILIIVAAALICAAVVINLAVCLSVRGDILTPAEASSLENIDCVIVLGAGVRPDGTPSLMLRDRLDTALELWEAGVSEKLLVSGDHGRESYDEVNSMKSYAIDAGVPSEDVFMDHAGFSTYETMYRARDVFEAERVVIVTQRYHLYRAVYIAKALGLDAVGVAAEDIPYSGQLYRDAREAAARVKDFFSVILKPEPTYLGEAIPVAGNGDTTNDR